MDCRSWNAIDKMHFPVAVVRNYSAGAKFIVEVADAFINAYMYSTISINAFYCTQSFNSQISVGLFHLTNL